MAEAEETDLGADAYISNVHARRGRIAGTEMNRAAVQLSR